MNWITITLLFRIVVARYWSTLDNFFFQFPSHTHISVSISFRQKDFNQSFHLRFFLLLFIGSSQAIFVIFFPFFKRNYRFFFFPFHFHLFPLLAICLHIVCLFFFWCLPSVILTWTIESNSCVSFNCYYEREEWRKKIKKTNHSNISANAKPNFHVYTVLHSVFFFVSSS